jgi:hypothetical protein
MEAARALQMCKLPSGLVRRFLIQPPGFPRITKSKSGVKGNNKKIGALIGDLHSNRSDFQLSLSYFRTLDLHHEDIILDAKSAIVHEAKTRLLL